MTGWGDRSLAAALALTLAAVVADRLWHRRHAGA